MKLRTTAFSVALASFSLVLTGCGDSSPEANDVNTNSPQASAVPVEGTTFVVTGVTQDGTDRPVVKGSEIRLEFVDGRLVVTAGCNTMSGDYEQDGSKLTVSPMGVTMMACEPALMEQDAWLGKLFEAPVELTTGKDASLVSGDVVLSLADRKDVSPDRPLVGTRWKLDGLVSAESVSSVPLGVRASLTIDEAGSAFVHDGCNRGNGTATVEGESITWGERAKTRMACPGEGEQEVQDAFAAVLDGDTTFTIVEKTLTVTKGDRALTFVAAGK